MNNPILLLLSFTVGILVVIQGSITARFGVMLNNVVLATTIALMISASFTIVAAITTVRNFPSMDQIQAVTTYIWCTGGVLSFLAVSLFYFIIPRVGISKAVTFGLAARLYLPLLSAI